MFQHGMSFAQVNALAEKFAKLTPTGWEIPDWINLLYKGIKL